MADTPGRRLAFDEIEIDSSRLIRMIQEAQQFFASLLNNERLGGLTEDQFIEELLDGDILVKLARYAAGKQGISPVKAPTNVTPSKTVNKNFSEYVITLSIYINRPHVTPFP